MTQAQKIAKDKFKKAIEYRKKTGVSLKEAFAHIYEKKVGAVKKKDAPKKKPAPKKVASKRITDIHKDSKSHNVRISVVSGTKKKKVGDYKNRGVVYKDPKGIKTKAKGSYKVVRSKAGKFANFSKIGALYEFFDVKGLTDIDSLKKSYFKLAKVYHPDAGGTKEQFQRLQKEYEGLFKTIMSGSNLSANDIANEIELDENLRQAVDAIIGIPQLNVELIGKWIWVSGNTYPIRNELKNAGFMFAPVKKMWYYKGIESAGRGKLTIDEIRKKYGTQAIQKEGMKKIQGIGEYISPAKKKKFFLSLKKALKALDNRKDQKIIISGIINKIH
jgi:hypothetical protein